MTYLPLALAGIGVAAVVFAVAVPRWRSRGVLRDVTVAVTVTALALMVLTVVFDSLMIGAGLFRYRDGSLVGVTLWRAPVEDLSYPLAAALLLPAVWELARREDA
ncbi:lycopene cyclase domain-containing protein [Luteimicrobium subarcticum]|uniref:Lycopene cyclase domain-containing protein n=1 Tax=Luteimicrobium subarcticum TaxID=620910 RepID=A0A2M8WTB3_9MICO|nr:lycopene cyclase domain-containing protein [Luteimicrobium subarcticum]PJI94185.1 lycopene cyclase domain-containing protein [Luteimicrobium subarcticum]